MKYLLPFLLIVILTACSSESADLLIVNAKIWTGNDQQPNATWVAVKDGRILSLGNDSHPFDGYAEAKLNAAGQLLLPGINDSHVHFAQAGHLLLNINLLDVSNDSLLAERLKATVARLPKGSWITGGDWGAYEAWNMGSAGGRAKATYVPSLSLVESLTPDHPVILTRYDRKVGLANHAAQAHFNLNTPDGIVKGAELDTLLKNLPPKSFEQRLSEARRALAELRRWGITTVQDMSPPDQLDVYKKLLENGELTCRINFSPSRLIEYKDMVQKGWLIDWSDPSHPHPAGDEWISFGTLKTHIDGIMGGRSARFFEPYSDNDVENVAWRGGWREFSRDMKSFKSMILEADRSGIQLRIHSIGDEANSILLDILDSMKAVNGNRPRRFRIVHAQVIRPSDFPRFKNHQVIAEVQPYHVTDDMRWMEERIGSERCRGAYAFKTLADNGCTLSFGSDWPGTNASYYPVNPYLGLYAAVTRKTLQGQPEEGWFPEQRVPIEQAVRAYTWGSSYGAYEESIKGTIEKGKLADFTVLDTDVFTTSPEKWIQGRVQYTIVGGKLVYDRKRDGDPTP